MKFYLDIFIYLFIKELGNANDLEQYKIIRAEFSS